MGFFRPSELECRCTRLDCDAPEMNDVFMEKLNLLRELWGRPLIVLSAVRCVEHNREVHGAEKSWHLTGQAVDLKIGSTVEGKLIGQLAERIGFGGIGIYKKGWIHVDMGPSRKWFQ